MIVNGIVCPTNRLAMDLLVKKYNGDEVAAMKEWKEAGYEFSQDILAQAAALSEVTELEEDLSVDPLLAKEHEFLTNAKSLLTAKIDRIQKTLKDKKKGEEGLTRLKELLAEFDTLDETNGKLIINRFLIAADRMSSSSEKLFKDIKEGKKGANPAFMQRMVEYTESLNIVSEISDELLEDETLVEHKQTVKDILARIRKVKKDYLEIFQDQTAKKAAGSFKKIQAKRREEYGIEYDRNFKRDDISKGLSPKQVIQAKKEYIDKKMILNAKQIEADTFNYVKEMLKRTTDISTITEWVVNPKDMNHDIMSLATEFLDKQDFRIRNSNYDKLHEAQSLYDEYVKQVGSSSDMKKLYAPILEKNPDGSVKPIIINQNSPGWKQFKKDNEGNAIWNFQQFLARVVNEKGKIVPNFANIGFQLPKINKSSLERMQSNGVWHTIREKYLDFSKLRGSDTEFGALEYVEDESSNSNKIKVITDETGRERELIPIHYRYKVEDEDLSYDVLSSILLDYDNSLKYEAKSEAAVFLQGLKDSVKEADIIQTTSFRQRLKVNRNDKVVTRKGESNLEKAIDNLIRHRVYGISVEGDPKLVKTMNVIKSYTSLVGLGLNVYAGVTNYLQGTAMNWLEATGNSTGAYNKDNLLNAVVKYQNPKDLTDRLADTTRRVPISRVNLLMEIFNPGSEHYSVSNDAFIQDNVIKRKANTGALMVIDSLGQHALHANLMYAILDNIKVLNTEGSYLDKDFKPTKDRSKALSIDEAMYIEENGRMAVDPRVYATERTNGVSVDDLQQISGIIRRTARDLYGNYDSNNKSKIQRMAVLSLATQMRGWLVPGIQKRWRGLGTANRSLQDLTIEQRSFNAETNEFEEGIYTSTIRFITQLAKEWRGLKMEMVAENWNNLTDQEKANIKKTVYEVGTFTLMVIVSTLLAGDADDEDDNKLYLAYFARRMYSELSTYTNPKEAIRTFKNPMMSVSTINNGLDILIQHITDLGSVAFGGEAERYKQGDRKGQLKAGKLWEDMIPVLNQNTKIQDKYNFLVKSM